MAFKNKGWNKAYQRQIDWEYKKAKYAQYLKSDEWARKREKLFLLVGRQCEFCKKSGIVEVHHLVYDRIENERLTDLVVVCKECHPILDTHRKAHKLQRNFSRWVYSKYGESWRGKTELFDIFKLFAYENYNKKPSELKTFFGVRIK